MNKTLDVFHEACWVQLAKSPRQRQTGRSSAKLWECVNRRLLSRRVLMLLALFWLTQRTFPRGTLGTLGRSPPRLALWWAAPDAGQTWGPARRRCSLAALCCASRNPCLPVLPVASCPRPVYVKEEPLFQFEILNKIILFLFQYRWITHSL